MQWQQQNCENKLLSAGALSHTHSFKGENRIWLHHPVPFLLNVSPCVPPTAPPVIHAIINSLLSSRAGSHGVQPYLIQLISDQTSASASRRSIILIHFLWTQSHVTQLPYVGAHIYDITCPQKSVLETDWWLFVVLQSLCYRQVTVIDGPVTTRQSTVWVIVHVEDENDNPPTFPEVTYRISLTERDRNKRGEPVYRVFAYDRDLGANSNITYSIVDGNEDEKFIIDPRTAMVSSKKMVTAGSYDILTVSYTLSWEKAALRISITFHS